MEGVLRRYRGVRLLFGKTGSQKGQSCPSESADGYHLNVVTKRVGKIAAAVAIKNIKFSIRIYARQSGRPEAVHQQRYFWQKPPNH